MSRAVNNTKAPQKDRKLKVHDLSAENKPQTALQPTSEKPNEIQNEPDLARIVTQRYLNSERKPQTMLALNAMTRSHSENDPTLR